MANDDNPNVTISASSPVPAFAKSPVLEAEVILQELTNRQHLSPHTSLQEVLAQTRACPVAADRAMEWLGFGRHAPHRTSQARRTDPACQQSPPLLEARDGE